MNNKTWHSESGKWRRELEVGNISFSVPFFCEEGEVVKNSITGESIELTAEELDVYDLIKGFEKMTEIRFQRPTIFTSLVSQQVWDAMEKRYQVAILWFRVHNNQAWRILLD